MDRKPTTRFARTTQPEADQAVELCPRCHCENEPGRHAPSCNRQAGSLKRRGLGGLKPRGL